MNKTEKEQILEIYCENEMRRLKQMCYPKIQRIGGISQMDYDDLYSIALEALRDSVERYDEEWDCQFEHYLSGNINRRFTTYIRDRNRKKHTMWGYREEDMEAVEQLASDFNMEEVVVERVDALADERIIQYMKRLSRKQRQVVTLMMDGYGEKEIRDQLHMTKQDYTDQILGIRAYENVRILYR